MVSEQMDMLGRDDAQPPESRIDLVAEIIANGEAIVAFEDGRVVEFHGDDTHVYPDAGVLFTETEEADGDEEAESWFYADEIVSVQRH